MCGAFSIRISPYEYQFFSNPRDFHKWNAIYNARPSEYLPIATEENPKQLTSAYWGFVPHWMDPKKGRAVINARAESITQKPYFRAAMKSQRCIIPADGFYEWQAGPKGKTPYYFYRKDKKLFSFAGVYDLLPGKKDELGFAIITTTPNSLVAKVHDRMPVMLNDESVEDWLNPDTTADQAEKLLTPYPATQMAAYAVSRAVNFARNKGPEVIEPLATRTGGSLG